MHNDIMAVGSKDRPHMLATGRYALWSARNHKRVKDYAYHKEKMMLCKHEEKCVPLSIDKGDWLDETDEEPDEQQLEAHYMYMAKNQEFLTAESRPTFDVDSNVIPNSSYMCDNKGKDDQNAEEYEDEHVVLANLITNLKLDIDENKNIQKQLKKANASLTHELNECKYAREESNDIRHRCISALHDQEIELEKYKKYKIVKLKNKR
uniref:Gag-Pol polyprotein n=1 Tax=Tanacetum cinerariifolium TaxID=118510 RepID=A0A6L2N0T0_TANCI|nr:hypothetical protein [Tanacetum cinerariifolium]